MPHFTACVTVPKNPPPITYDTIGDNDPCGNTMYGTISHPYERNSPQYQDMMRIIDRATFYTRRDVKDGSFYDDFENNWFALSMESGNTRAIEFPMYPVE